jgi:hypothetical protein
VIAPPPAGADAALYFISGGKVTEAPGLPETVPALTLRDLWDGYEGSLPPGAKDSLPTEAVHFRHFFRLLGATRSVLSLTTDGMQAYVNPRQKERGLRAKTVAPDTVKTEIGTLSFVWDALARRHR